MTGIKKKLSNAGNYNRGILITGSGAPGITLHTAASGIGVFDEVWIYAANNHSTSVDLTVRWGNLNSLTRSVPNRDLCLVVPGIPLTNSGVISAYASVTGVINIFGYVNGLS